MKVLILIFQLSKEFYMYKNIIFLTILLFSLSSQCFSWHDQTHMAVATAAGFKNSYMLVGPDIARLKAGNIESFNHWCNNDENHLLTKEQVLAQIEKYNSTDSGEEKGHLYGAIIGAVIAYQKDKSEGKYAEYHLGYLGHYVGDLSNPLHNIAYNEFNKNHHNINDGIIENEIAFSINNIVITEIVINSIDDIANEIVKIANDAKELGYKMEKENRNMTKVEAYAQISKSASFFKGILKYLGVL